MRKSRWYELHTCINCSIARHRLFWCFQGLCPNCGCTLTVSVVLRKVFPILWNPFKYTLEGRDPSDNKWIKEHGNKPLHNNTL